MSDRAIALSILANVTGRADHAPDVLGQFANIVARMGELRDDDDYDGAMPSIAESIARLALMGIAPGVLSDFMTEYCEQLN